MVRLFRGGLFLFPFDAKCCLSVLFILTNLQPIIIVEAFPEGGLCFHLTEIKAFLPEDLSVRGKESCEQI